MSLGTGALKVSGVPDAIVAGRYDGNPGMHWKSVEITYMYLKRYLPWQQMQNREERLQEFAMIRNN